MSAGSAASFVVRVSSALASNNLLIEVSQPPGTELLSGGMRWAGSILPGEVRELHFTLQLPAQEVPPINATATIQSASGAQLAAADVYRQVVALPAALKTTQGRKVSRQGRAVMEYSLR
ncbi:hypothetical protein [Kaarinaea lacus]